MKTKIFLAMGLLASIYGYGQTYAAPTGGVNPAGTGGTDNLHLGHSAGADPLNAASQKRFCWNESRRRE